MVIFHFAFCMFTRGHQFTPLSQPLVAPQDPKVDTVPSSGLTSSASAPLLKARIWMLGLRMRICCMFIYECLIVTMMYYDNIWLLLTIIAVVVIFSQLLLLVLLCIVICLTCTVVIIVVFLNHCRMMFAMCFYWLSIISVDCIWSELTEMFVHWDAHQDPPTQMGKFRHGPSIIGKRFIHQWDFSSNMDGFVINEWLTGA